MVKGRAVIVGKVEVLEIDDENFKHDLALVVVFDTAADVRQALSDGHCAFYLGPSTAEHEGDNA